MKFLKEKQDGIICFPYKDSEGNVLTGEEILFVSSNKKGKQLVEMWKEELNEVQGTHVYEEGLKWYFDKPGVFPVVIRRENGEILDQKISKKTGEYLPAHAGSCENIPATLIGASNCGKTTSMVQWSDPSFQNSVMRGLNCSMMNDAPKGSPCEQEYLSYLEQFKNKVLPERTRYSGKLNSFVYYVKNGKRDANLVLLDASGEECIRAGWDSQILHSKYLIYMIGADDLLAGEKTGSSQYEQVLQEVIRKKNITDEEKDFETLVVITKCDLLDCNNPYLKRAFENSIKVEGDRLIQITHNEGFDCVSFQEKSDAIEKYLADVCPRFFNNLKNLVPSGKLNFAMMANIGEECVDNKFQNYQPINIDEPILYILAKEGLYPIAKEVYGDDGMEIPPILPKTVIEKWKEFKNLLLMDEEE